MKKLLSLLFIILLASCNKQYMYVELVNENYSIKEEEVVIKAKNDTTAYLLAYEKFCISLAATDAIKKRVGFVFKEPVNFKLFNKDGVDLVESISFKTKETKEKEIADRISAIHLRTQANVQPTVEEKDSLGIWNIDYFVDEFNEPTTEGYITNKELFSGEFSNSATDGSPLLVRFIIPRKSRIQIVLYEYGKNPMKGYHDTYFVSILDKDKVKHKLMASCWDSDRLTMSDFTTSGKTDSEKLHDILIAGGQIKFVIIDSDRSVNQFSFTIDNAEKYDIAYTALGRTPK